MNLLFWQIFMLAQTEQEKQITYIGVLIFALLIFSLIIDSMAKGKVIPKKGPLKKVLIFIFLIVIVVAIFLTKFYK